MWQHGVVYLSPGTWSRSALTDAPLVLTETGNEGVGCQVWVKERFCWERWVKVVGSYKQFISLQEIIVP